MKIELGGGLNPEDGYVNLDRVETADVVIDLDIEGLILPYEDGVIKGCHANNFLEHVRNLQSLMNEVYRVLAKGKKFTIIVPYVAVGLPYVEAFQDPTHVRFFTDTSFSYFVEANYLGEKYGKSYGFKLWESKKQYTDACFLYVELKK